MIEENPLSQTLFIIKNNNGLIIYFQSVNYNSLFSYLGEVSNRNFYITSKLKIPNEKGELTEFEVKNIEVFVCNEQRFTDEGLPYFIQISISISKLLNE